MHTTHNSALGTRHSALGTRHSALVVALLFVIGAPTTVQAGPGQALSDCSHTEACELPNSNLPPCGYDPASYLVTCSLQTYGQTCHGTGIDVEAITQGSGARHLIISGSCPLSDMTTESFCCAMDQIRAPVSDLYIEGTVLSDTISLTDGTSSLEPASGATQLTVEIHAGDDDDIMDVPLFGDGTVEHIRRTGSIDDTHWDSIIAGMGGITTINGVADRYDECVQVQTTYGSF